MSRHWVEYSDERVRSPLTFWVHRERPGESWSLGSELEPPLPGPVGGKGYPKFFVSVADFEFRFASLEEMRHCIDVLSRKDLPTSLELSAERGSGASPKSHWLSRLPRRAKSWRFRERALGRLADALAAFEADGEGAAR